VPLFGRKKKPTSDAQAVITHVPLSDDAFGTTEEREAIFAVEDRLSEAAGLLEAVTSSLGDFPIRPTR
jgi:hypothetical protein